MSNLTHLILFVSFLIIKGVAQNAVIIAPATFILGINDLTINCKPAGLLYNQISAISILKNYQPMVNVGKSTVLWSDLSVQSRARTNSPNLDTVSISQLIVNISASNTQCDDQAVYTCRVVGLDSSFNVVLDNEVSKHVFVVVKPDRMDSMTLFPLPSKKGLYSEGQNITLSCAGTVGLYSNPLKITWCIERSDNPNPSNLETDKYFLSETQSDAHSKLQLFPRILLTKIIG
ncbi:hypothetical protein KUTeg_020315 [Tegillarca granosa]|uniref:Ig-like domain-containing protein n=1 Tax=Tegillarca granosa TaxID=220873 RepID=A0ABQ9E7I1_TEGGR|nr:hypothetical protein KUTeg_020315 [Tegillarca granosa]